MPATDVSPAAPRRSAAPQQQKQGQGSETVAVLLVSHDGGRWLPTVLEGLAGQQAEIACSVAVDTGSKDDSRELLEQAFGEGNVVSAPSSTAFPAAVRLGLDRLERLVAETGVDIEWVWLLHDDSSPHPEALLALLAGAAEHPDADVLGPMLREWPSLKRLLELGVTISGTGRRETGLERGEYDQGQYAEPRAVLAVNTAGMLVRRRVLAELDGFEDRLPIFGNDLDFGWRAAAAGHRTLVIPQAIVFHAEAAHRGLRRTPLTGRHTHYHERRAALFTLLANSSTRALPLRVVRLTLGTFVRMLGFLLVRSPGEALDELAALVSVASAPRDLRAARRSRRVQATAPPEQVRDLLAPWWLPYRHGLDAVGDLLSAATQQVADVAERRRAAAAERDPSSFAARRTERLEQLEEEELADTGLVARFLTNPVAVLLAVFLVALVVGARDGLGAVAGGGLSPAPEWASDWWALHLDSWHELGPGTAVPAPAYVLPLALLATLLGGSPVTAVSVVLVLSAPLAAWGAWRFLRVAGRLAAPAGAPRWLILWGATAYALVPALSGAWGDGRLSVVVAAAVLPWLAHAALGFADPEPDRRWRAAWRSGLLLTVVTAVAPVAWLFTVVIGAVVVALAFLLLPRVMRDRSTWAPPATAVAVVPLLLAPWWLPLLLEGAGAGLLLDAGRPPAPALDGVDLALGRFGDLGAPWWLGLVLPALGVLALVPRRTRTPVLVCWVVASTAALVALAISPVRPDLTALAVPAGTGFLLVVGQGALVTAVVLGALGALESGIPARWRRPAFGVLAVAALTLPVAGLGWFVGFADARLDEDLDAGIPAYMEIASRAGPEHGILVVRGSVADGLTYTIRRGDGVTLGEDEVLALTPEDDELTTLVQTLTARPTPDVADRLASWGLEYVVLPAPADPDVAGAVDAAAGLVPASAEDRSTRAWQVDRPLSAATVDGSSASSTGSPARWLRVALLVVQALTILVIAVLCAPTIDRKAR